MATRTTKRSEWRDGLDEMRAALYRRVLGRDGWLVSWYGRDDGSWLARVSCPQWPDTIEEVGESRCDSLRRGIEALKQIIRDAGKEVRGPVVPGV